MNQDKNPNCYLDSKQIVVLHASPDYPFALPHSNLLHASFHYKLQFGLPLGLLCVLLWTQSPSIYKIHPPTLCICPKTFSVWHLQSDIFLKTLPVSHNDKSVMIPSILLAPLLLAAILYAITTILSLILQTYTTTVLLYLHHNYLSNWTSQCQEKQ